MCSVALLAQVVGVISVLTHGAVPDDETNDRAEIDAALTAGAVAGETVHFPAGLYLVNGDSGGVQIDVAATSRVTVTADAGAVLFGVCGGEGQYETMLRFTSAAHGVSISDLEVQGNGCAGHLVSINYSGDADNTAAIDGMTISGATQTSGTNFGIGLRILGGFTAIDIADTAVDDASTTQDCDTGASRGIEIQPSCGASDYYTDTITIDGVTISNVTDPEGDGCNSDGVFVQTACETVPAGTWEITDSTFEDCEYRSIKAQAIGGTVSGSTFLRTLATGHHEVDCQYSDCTVADNTFTSIGFAASSAAGAAIRDIATDMDFEFSGNDVRYIDVQGTYPVQVYDQTTAGGNVDEVLIEDNLIRGTVTALVFIETPFAGTHDITIQRNHVEYLTADGGLMHLEEDIDVGGAIIRNKIGARQHRPSATPSSEGHMSWDDAYGNVGFGLLP